MTRYALAEKCTVPPEVPSAVCCPKRCSIIVSAIANGAVFFRILHGFDQMRLPETENLHQSEDQNRRLSQKVISRCVAQTEEGCEGWARAPRMCSR